MTDCAFQTSGLAGRSRIFVTPDYTLIEHRNGRLYVLISGPKLSEQQRQQIARDVAQRSGRKILGVAPSIPTQSSGGATNYRLVMTGFHTDENIAAFRSALAEHGDTSPGLSNPSYVMGKMPHLLYTEQVRLLEAVEPRSERHAKVMEAIERSYKHMPSEVAEQVRAVFTAENIALMAATLAVYAAAHFFGIGFLIDIILYGVALVALGAIATRALFLFIDFYTKAASANTEAELEAAAKIFAEVVLTIGVGATAAILTRRPMSPAGRANNDATLLSRSFSPGKSTVPEAVAQVRGKVIASKDGRTTLFGPEAKRKGVALNMTDDGPFAISTEWMRQDTFFVAAHALKNSLTFFRNEAGTGAIQPRGMAIQMWKNGYIGGDIVLIACETGLNRALVKSLHAELSALRLQKPVGTIHAPSREINGKDVLGLPRPEKEPLKWESFSF